MFTHICMNYRFEEDLHVVETFSHRTIFMEVILLCLLLNKLHLFSKTHFQFKMLPLPMRRVELQVLYRYGLSTVRNM